MWKKGLIVLGKVLCSSLISICLKRDEILKKQRKKHFFLKRSSSRKLPYFFATRKGKDPNWEDLLLFGEGWHRGRLERSWANTPEMYPHRLEEKLLV